MASPGTSGLLLLNLGTPRSPATGDVRDYLREFLSDPYVLDVPAPVRWLLLNLVILPFRPSRSAHAYRQIWSDRGSPLLVHGEELRTKVAERLGAGVAVELAMRYGEPAIAEALTRLREQGVRDIAVFPLYPQHSSAATESSVEAVRSAAAGSGVHVERRAGLLRPPSLHRGRRRGRQAHARRRRTGASGLQLPRPAGADRCRKAGHKRALLLRPRLLALVATAPPSTATERSVSRLRQAVGDALATPGEQRVVALSVAFRARTLDTARTQTACSPSLPARACDESLWIMPGFVAGLPGDARGDRHSWGCHLPRARRRAAIPRALRQRQ